MQAGVTHAAAQVDSSDIVVLDYRSQEGLIANGVTGLASTIDKRLGRERRACVDEVSNQPVAAVDGPAVRIVQEWPHSRRSAIGYRILTTLAITAVSNLPSATIGTAIRLQGLAAKQGRSQLLIVVTRDILQRQMSSQNSNRTLLPRRAHSLVLSVGSPTTSRVGRSSRGRQQDAVIVGMPRSTGATRASRVVSSRFCRR